VFQQRVFDSFKFGEKGPIPLFVLAPPGEGLLFLFIRLLFLSIGLLFLAIDASSP